MKLESVIAIIAYVLGFAMGSILVGNFGYNYGYEQGVKDCLNNKVKIEIKQDTLIIR